MKKIIKVALIGNPNCGKSTLFNALTGAKARIGNFPGITVEKKTGQFTVDDFTVELIDLPGIYSLIVADKHNSLDEKVVSDYLAENNFDLIVNVVDSSNLIRNLYLSLQLLELKLPMLIVANMQDLAKKNGIKIDHEKLAKTFSCPVLPISSLKKGTHDNLKQSIVASSFKPHCPLPNNFNQNLSQIKDKYFHLIKDKLNIAADELHDLDLLILRFLEGDHKAKQRLSTLVSDNEFLQQLIPNDVDVHIAKCRYDYLSDLEEEVIVQTKKANIVKDKIDKIVLHKFFGIIIFFAIMYSLFVFAINIAGIFNDFFNISSKALFVDGPNNLLTNLHAPDWLTNLITHAGAGLNTTISFIPVIAGMFFYLAILEDSGYMARGALVIDKLLRAIGLPGKSFVPLIIGFGCNVPGIMATRTLENKRDRIVTIMMSPFMSCGARLAIFTVFVSAFYQQGGHNIIFLLYVIGILTAIFTALLLKSTILKSDVSPMILELPPYRLPKLKSVLKHTAFRLKTFIMRAGKLIVPVCLVLGSLNSYNYQDKSLLAHVGQTLTPIFKPMGVSEDNWPATVGLVSGVLAKEVVVGTLNTLYSPDGNKEEVKDFSLSLSFKEAVTSIKDNFFSLKSSLFNPVISSAPIEEMDKSAMGVMYKYFQSNIAAFSYLLFVLLYLPCVSTVAAIAKELNYKWALFSVLWTTGLAYIVAVSCFQIASFKLHPFISLTWLTSFACTIGIFIYICQKMAKTLFNRHVINKKPLPLNVVTLS